MKRLIYEGKDAIFGRLASVVTKNLMKGKSVEIINCGEIIVSGDKKLFVGRIFAKRKMGSGSSLKGPKYPRVADRLVKRMIRGMLPRGKAKGQEAFKRLRCYVGNGGLKEDALKDVVKLNHRKPRKHFTIKEVVGLLK